MLRVRTAMSGWSGGPGLATMYFRVPIEDVAAATRCVEYVRRLTFGEWRQWIRDDVTFQISGDVDVINQVTGDVTNVLSVAAPAGFPGSGGVDPAPPVLAGLLRLSTAVFIGGRRVRGRMFISPLAASAINTFGELTNAAVVNLASLKGVFDGVRAGGDEWVVWHRPKNGTGGQDVAVQITSSLPKLAVLRSRRD